MYVLTNDAFYAFRAIAMLVVAALVLWSFGIAGFPQNAEAANVTSFSDLLTDSNPGSVSNHTISFAMPNGMLIGETFVITFPAGFTLGAVSTGDLDLVIAGAGEQTLATTTAAAGTWGVVMGAQTISFETPTDGGVASSATATIEIGTNATAGETGQNQISNPTAGSHEITVTGTMVDSGRTRVAIIDNVLVTAEVTTTFDFVINGRASTTIVNGSPTSTATDTTATALPFGVLSSDVSKTLGQHLQVTSNAINGFVVTIEQDNNLQSSTGADIDGFIDGAYTDTPTGWVDPTEGIANENTWGHWGLTTEDTDLEGAGTDFAADQWVAASTTPRAIFAHDGPSDGATSGVGSTTVGFQAQISPLQEAGDDYSTILTYIATPTF